MITLIPTQDHIDESVSASSPAPLSSAPSSQQTCRRSYASRNSAELEASRMLMLRRRPSDLHDLDCP